MVQARAIAFGLFVLLIVGCGQKKDVSERRTKLLKAIESKDWDVRVRAIQELSRVADQDEAVQELMVELLFSDEVDPDLDGEFYMLLRVSAQTSAPRLRTLINKYESGKLGTGNLKKLLLILGRIGPKGRSAVPFLLRQLQKEANNPDAVGIVRIVLANVGYESQDNLAKILSDIRNRTESGKSAVHTIARVGAGGWVNDELIAQLVERLVQGETGEWLSAHGDESAYAALALASLGQKAAGAVTDLEELLQYVWEQEHYATYRILYGFSLMKVQAAQSDKVLSDVLRYMGSEDFGNHTDYVALDMVRPLVTHELVSQIRGALNHDNPEIVRGAIGMLWIIGLDGQQYAQDLLKILRENPDKDLREAAAEALGRIASMADVPALRGIFAKEKSRFVRNEIAKAIRIMRLEPEE
jgi:HEAT repeat protein